MTANQSRLLGVALLLSSVSLLLYITQGSDARDTGSGPAEQNVQEAQRRLDAERARARLAAGAYIARS